MVYIIIIALNIIHAVARIGFVQCPGVFDTIQEDDRFTKLPVALLDSDITLGGEVIVQFSTRDASATGQSKHT